MLHERLPRSAFADLPALARGIKALPLTLSAARPIEEAISSAGGVRLDALDRGLMLKASPGVFCAGEMLDWDAPTGGYLLTASMASGRVAAGGVADSAGAPPLSAARRSGTPGDAEGRHTRSAPHTKKKCTRLNPVAPGARRDGGR